MSSTPLYTTRIEPAVKRLLPPASSSGAASSITTLAPCSCAASAAQNAALPPPTTITSYSDIVPHLLHVLIRHPEVRASWRASKDGGHHPGRTLRGALRAHLRVTERGLDQFSTTRHSIVSPPR